MTQADIGHGSTVRGVIRGVLFALWMLPCLAIQAVVISARLEAHYFTIPRLFWRVCAKIFGFEIIVRGQPGQARPTLFVSNHISYLDIMVLSSVLPAGYVSKAEVRDWPVFGLMARLNNTVFIDRRARNVRDHSNGIQDKLNAGCNLILFPEGTSTDGNGVMPFKSSLFGVCSLPLKNGQALSVQPVAIAYVGMDGMALGRDMRPLYAWFGDMTLSPHLWQVLKLGRALVVVEFLSPVDLPQFGSRKALADHCHHVIAHAVGIANAGRLPEIEARLLPPA